MKKLIKFFLNSPYVVWSALFVIVPLLMIVFYAFTDANGTFTLSNILELGSYTLTLGLSLLFSLAATVITLAIGYPFALALSKLPQKYQKIQMMLIMLPMWINFLIRTYGWKNILETKGLINSFLGLFNIGPINFLGPAAVIIVMAYDYLPYMILPIYTVISKMDPALTEAARDLGCNSFNVWRRVVLPLSVPGIVSGITMVFVPSVSSFYISSIMSDNNINLIGNVIENYMKGGSSGSTNFNLGAALSLVLAVLILVSVIIMDRFTDGSEEGGLVV